MSEDKRIDFDYKQLTGLAQMQCTFEEIANFFNCSVKTVQRRYDDDEQFADIIEKGRATGKYSVRKKQFEIMNSGNTQMAIWLGKQYLNQKDKQEVDQYNQTEPVTVNIIAPNEGHISNWSTV